MHQFVCFLHFEDRFKKQRLLIDGVSSHIHVKGQGGYLRARSETVQVPIWLQNVPSLFDDKGNMAINVIDFVRKGKTKE